MRQDSAFEEGLALVLHELRQVGAGSAFGLLEKSRGVLLNQAVQNGLFRAVALVVNRGARRPAGAAGKWVARRAPGVMNPHGLKFCAAPRSPLCRLPMCPLVRGHDGCLCASRPAASRVEFRTRMSLQGRDPVLTNVSFIAAQFDRQVSGNEFSALVGWTRPGHPTAEIASG